MLFHQKKRLESHQLRSSRWFGPDDLRSFGHRSRLKQNGLSTSEVADKPVIGILNTWNDLNSCHGHFRDRAEEIKRGVWQSGGYPVEIPVMSLSETFMKPTAMYYRNLLSLETEETLRCYPIDAAVLMGGCDKTTPALIMGAVSAGVPFLLMPGGPMMRASWRGEPQASGTDVWRHWAERGAGRLSCDDWQDFEDHIAPSAGHCMTMGTASTMTSLAEVLGLTLPGAASIPAVHAAHSRMAAQCGQQAVELAWYDCRPEEILSRRAFENAITTDMAIGGSTNAIVHLIAMAGRAGIPLSLSDFDEISQRTPVLANIKPSGQYVMADFYDAGGLRGLLNQIQGLLHLDCPTVAGTTLGENISDAPVYDQDVIRPLGNPLLEKGGTAVLYGNLAPDGCVIKPSAADRSLLQHTGPAIVFENYRDLRKRLNDPDLDVTANHVMVLKGTGPLAAGMPESGMLPIPKKLLEAGVRDMVRISDARMSGTSYGTCVLHISPESSAGGPLAVVQDGDLIELDVSGRKIHLHVSAEQLQRRLENWKSPDPHLSRGYGKLYFDETTQAHEGCDFRFLHNDGSRGPDPEID